MTIEIKSGYLIFHCGCSFKILNKEPLKIELRHFLDKKFTKKELDDAIKNVEAILG